MRKRLELIGQKFGRLTVIKFSHIDKSGHTYWKCKCDCGNETIVQGSSLKNGNTKSCGCLYAESTVKNRVAGAAKYRLPEGVAARNHILHNHKKNAKRRNIEQTLTDEQILELHKGNCYYCGALPSNINSPKHGNGSYIYNGIDRIDNNKGYALANVVSCCKTCNYAKKDMSMEEFTVWLNRLINYNI